MRARFQSYLLINTCLLCVCLNAQALESNLSVGGGKSTVSWSSIVDRQYKVYATDDLSEPRANWDLVDTWLVGDGTTLSVEESQGSHRFYVVEERDEFIIDVVSMGYGTVGNNWVYTVDDSRESGTYTASYEVDGTQTSPQADDDREVIVVSATRSDDATWEQLLYVLNDFDNGLFQVGGVNPPSDAGPTEFYNNPAAPLLLNQFTPGIVEPADYVSTFYGDTDNTIQHEITTYLLPGGSEESTAIQVTSHFTAQITVQRQVIFFGLIDVLVNITSTTIDTYVPGVGLVKKVVDVDAIPANPDYRSYAEYIDATVTLQSFTPAP